MLGDRSLTWKSRLSTPRRTSIHSVSLVGSVTVTVVVPPPSRGIAGGRYGPPSDQPRRNDNKQCPSPAPSIRSIFGQIYIWRVSVTGKGLFRKFFLAPRPQRGAFLILAPTHSVTSPAAKKARTSAVQ